MVVEPPSIAVLQIVLSFFSRSILATQTNLSLILRKWYLHAGDGFPSNCHNIQPNNGFEEEMVTEPPSIAVLRIVQSFFQDPSYPLKPIFALSSRNGIYMLEFDSVQIAIKLNPAMTFKRKWLWNPLQLRSFKLY